MIEAELAEIIGIYITQNPNITSLTVDARVLTDYPSTFKGRIKDTNITFTQVFMAFAMRLTCLQPDAAFNVFGAKVHQRLRYNVIIIKNVLIFKGQPSGAVVSTIWQGPFCVELL